MRSLLLIVATVCALAPASAQERAIDTAQSTITVRVFKSGLFRAFADDHIIQASFAEGSLDPSENPHVQIALDASALRVLDPRLSAKDRQEVQSRMLSEEVLDVARFPRISFRSVTVQPLERDEWLVRGELELHGRMNPIMMKISLDNGHYKGSATLRQRDFGIAPISVLGGTVKVKDEVKIDFDVVVSGLVTPSEK